jgi:NIMA (never in mitosis gene a)-related kinase
MSSQIVIGQP